MILNFATTPKVLIHEIEEGLAWADVTIIPFDSNVETPDNKKELINSILEEIE